MPIYLFIFFSASLVPNEEGLFTGKIVIKSKNSQFKVQIPYRAFLLKGQLEVAPNVTHFYLTSKDPPLRRPLVSWFEKKKLQAVFSQFDFTWNYYFRLSPTNLTDPWLCITFLWHWRLWGFFDWKDLRGQWFWNRAKPKISLKWASLLRLWRTKYSTLIWPFTPTFRALIYIWFVTMEWLKL